MAKEWGIAANVISDKTLRAGANVRLLDRHGNADMVKVRGRSRGGRTVTKYLPFKRLQNFRAVWIEETYRQKVLILFDTKAEAQQSAEELAKMWAGIRFYSANGELLQDGEPESEAFVRLGE